MTLVLVTSGGVSTVVSTKPIIDWHWVDVRSVTTASAVASQHVARNHVQLMSCTLLYRLCCVSHVAC